MNNSIPRAMQGPRLSPGAVLTVPPDEILCLRCKQRWSNHEPGCAFEGVTLAPVPPPTPAAVAFDLMHSFTASAVELLREVYRTAVEDLDTDDRARVLPAISAAQDRAADLCGRLSRRLAIHTQSPGGLNE